MKINWLSFITEIVEIFFHSSMQKPSINQKKKKIFLMFITHEEQSESLTQLICI